MIISIVKVQKEIFLMKYNILCLSKALIGIDKMRPKWPSMASNTNYLNLGIDCGGLIGLIVVVIYSRFGYFIPKDGTTLREAYARQNG